MVLITCKANILNTLRPFRVKTIMDHTVETLFI
jgi:hypothetical protein